MTKKEVTASALEVRMKRGLGIQDALDYMWQAALDAAKKACQEKQCRHLGKQFSAGCEWCCALREAQSAIDALR